MKDKQGKEYFVMAGGRRGYIEDSKPIAMEEMMFDEDRIKKAVEEAMTATQYHDSDGNEVTLDELCRKEPAWAANVIRTLTKERDKAKAQEAELMGRLMAWKMQEDPDVREVLADCEGGILVDQIRVVWDDRITWHLEDMQGRHFNPIENKPGEAIFFVRVERRL